MTNIFPSRIAAIIYALVIGFFGVNHFMNADKMGGMVPSFMPGEGKIWIYVTGAALVAAAIAIIINKFAKTACYLLALMLLIFVFTMHLQNAMSSDEMLKMLGMTSLLKDTAMAMAAIIIGNNAHHK